MGVPEEEAERLVDVWVRRGVLCRSADGAFVPNSESEQERAEAAAAAGAAADDDDDDEAEEEEEDAMAAAVRADTERLTRMFAEGMLKSHGSMTMDKAVGMIRLFNAGKPAPQPRCQARRGASQRAIAGHVSPTFWASQGHCPRPWSGQR